MPVNHGHGTELPHYPENSAAMQLPEIGKGGIRYQSGDVVLSYFPVGTHEYHCIMPMESVVFPVGPAQRWASAFDSDKLVAEYAIPNTIGYCLQASQIYSVNLEREPKSHHLAVSFPPCFRHAIEEEMGDMSASLRTVNNLTPTLSTNFLIGQIQEFLNGGCLGGKLAAESLANLAVMEGLQALTRKTPQVKRLKLGKKSLTRTLDYIEENLIRDIGLKDLAQVAAMSLYHFARCFKNTTGLSPSAYVTSRRADQAKALLGKSDLSLMDITVACGFSSQSHLSKVIKQHTGMTPLHYRKVSQENR